MMTTISLMFVTVTTLSVPHIINSYWLVIFNAEDSAETLFNFFEKHYAANIVKDKTCFKSIDNPSCKHLFIINRSRCF